MKKSRILCLVLALVMCLSLVACGGNNDDTSGNDGTNPPDTGNDTSTDTSTEPQGPQPPEDDGTLMADVQHQSDFDQTTYDAQSDEIYDEVMGEFLSYYDEALAEVDPNVRIGKMAVAEAKMLEAGIFIPMQNNTSGYGISKIVPHSIPSISWGADGEYRGYKNALIINERPLTPAERTELTTLWSSLIGTGTWYEEAKKWVADHGFTLADSWNTSYTSEPETWDNLASAQATTGEPLSFTWEGLLAYDAENIQHPALAESYEVSDDGLTYTFHIRKGVKWVTYQGTEITEVKADDWVAAMQHIADTDGGLADLLLSTIKNLQAYVDGEITDFSQVGVKALDDYTLQYTFVTNAPWFLTLTGYGALQPLCRDYYVAQGGKFGEEFDSSASDYLYGKDPQHIAYCGPYLVSNYTYQNTIAYTANPSYWNADNVQIKSVTWRYLDGTDELASWNNFIDGTFNASVGLNTSAMEQAQKTASPSDPDKSYFEAYAYESHVGDTSIVYFNNVNRFAYANYNDETKVVSPKTVTQAERTRAAMLNQNFRMAICLAWNRADYMAISLGEDAKYGQLTNSYVPGSFCMSDAEFTVDINGTATTFPAGTYYGEVLQAQLTADGYPMKVWDPEGADGAGSSIGFDGWYNPDAAREYLDKAIAELADQGILINEDYPIYLDHYYRDYSTIGSSQDKYTQQCYEEVLGGLVKINLVATGDSKTLQNCYYYPTNGYQMNYDFGGSSGWSPDYGDAQTYLDTMTPHNYMPIAFGLY